MNASKARGVVPRAAGRRVVEELCNDSDCKRKPDTHWHPLSLESLLREEDGEYTLTVRVRTE
jgi:hypothetical protein